MEAFCSKLENIKRHTITANTFFRPKKQSVLTNAALGFCGI